MQDDGAGGTVGICLATCDPTSAASYGGCRTATSASRGYGCFPDLFDAAAGVCAPGCTDDSVCNWCDFSSGVCNDDLTACSTDADCAAAGHYACDVTTHLCHPDHPAGASAIGDPCTDLLDCPTNATCAYGGTGYPGGFCSMAGCGSYSSAAFACPAGSVCPALGGGAVNACAATCTVDGGNGSCDADRGDTNDYECNDAAAPAGGSASSYYAATGAAGFCWQCEALVPGGAGCP
jgi:hypothetical protein